MLWTIIRTKEYSPEELQEFSEKENSVDNHEVEPVRSLGSNIFMKRGFYWIAAGVIISLLMYYYSLEKELYILSVGIGAFGLIQIISGLLISGGNAKRRSCNCIKRPLS